MNCKYEKPVITHVGFEPSSGFLLGSKTDMPIIIDDLEVDDYDPGFTDPGGFKDINFD